MLETVEFTNMCMICDGNRVVVIDRQKKDWPGVTFPGGHVELGESFTDAVIREVREETGITISAPQLCGIKDWYEGNLQSSEEGRVWWEAVDQLPRLNLSLDMDDMLRVFTEPELSEFFYRQKHNQWVYDLK